MADTAGARDYERHQIDTIYQAGSDVASQLRRMADDIDRAIATAKKNEGTEDTFQPTFMDLPHNIQHIVQWGIANAGLEQVTRQVREYVSGQDAFRQIAERDRMTPQEIAENVTTGSIGGFGGISDNTRRIAYNAALEAVLHDRAVPCSECLATVRHKFGCSQRADDKGYVLPATTTEEV